MNKGYRMVGLEQNLHSELKKFCVLNGYTISGLVGKLVKDFIEKHDQTNRTGGKHDTGRN